MKLFSTMLADFTEEDWQDVKSEIKEFMVDQFKEMWEENYIWDCEEIEDLVAEHMNDFFTVCNSTIKVGSIKHDYHKGL